MRVPNSYERLLNKQNAKDESMKKNTKIVIVSFVIFILVLLGIYLGVGMYFKTRFFPGTSINEIDISSKTVEEAEQLIANQVQDYTLTILERDGKKEEISGAEMNFEYVSDGIVQDLMDVQTPFLWLGAYFQNDTYTMTTETTYDKELLKKAMKKLDCFQEDLVVKPEDAYIKESADGYELVKEVEGNQLDEDKVYQALVEAVDSGETQVDLDEKECYRKPKVTSEDAELKARYEALKKYETMTVTYDMGAGRQEVLDSATIRDWMSVSEDGEVSFNWNKAADWMSALSDKYDTFGTEMEFKTTLGETVTVNHETYGWKIDEATEVDVLLDILETGESADREPEYLEGAMQEGEDDIGDTYIEVDYVNQRMWFYKDGKLLVDTRVVTGNSSQKMDSPVGIFCIYNKETNAILKGEDYKTPVDFWLPYSGGVGIHDAKWRSAFGGEIYKTSGSHGCVNTPWEHAKTIFENVEIGTPVICYNTSTYKGEGTQNYEQPVETRNVEEELKARGETE